ncbi:hypothetical protein NE237_032261 [Protea cynaroides]|uniref:Uncharacterized protein n=1 Tax=Protea cynaroides TaxID=273540 RepID=A0A9Q0L2Z3_9MAGN|nr:hypothetical protein NE237_032261 [Protea cynaroides]
MDALWDLEEKLKLSTQGATLVFICTAFAIIGLCTTVLKKKKKKKNQKKNEKTRIQRNERVRGEEEATNTNKVGSSSSWGSIKKALMGSLRWSGASKVELELEETQALTWREGTPALLIGGRYEAEVEWHSHNSVSPVWQRPILMGEKCELPRFSGLILYDEQGCPLHHHKSQKTILDQEKPKAVATLKDLL